MKLILNCGNTLRWNKDEIITVVIMQLKQLQILNWKKKFQGFSRIWTHGLCVCTAVLHHLSYEDPHIGSRWIYWAHLTLWQEWNTDWNWFWTVYRWYENVIIAVVIEGCPIHPICNRLSNWWGFVMVRDFSSPFVSSWHVCNRTSSSALTVYECLWHHCFRMRNIVTLFLPVICLVCESSQPVTTHHPFWRPVTDRVHWTCML